MDGLAATLAAIALAFFAIDAVTTALERPRARGLARDRVRRAPASCRSTCARPGARSSSWATPAASLLGFALAALGLAASWHGRRDDGRDADPADPDPRRPDPRHDARHGRAPPRRTADLRRADATTRSHRLVRIGLSETSAVVAARARRDRPRRHEPRLQRRSTTARIAASASLITFALLVQFASFLADIDRGRRARPSIPARRSPCTGGAARRGARRLRADQRSFLGAYLLRVRAGPARRTSGTSSPISLPVILVARYLAFIPFGLYRCVWRYAGARDAIAAIAAAVVVSEVIALGFIVLTQPPLGDFSRERLRRRRADLHASLIVGVALRRAGDRRRALQHDPRPRRQPEPDRRRGPHRPQPAARAARDAGRARASASSTTTRGCAAAACRASRCSAASTSIERVLDKTKPDSCW